MTATVWTAETASNTQKMSRQLATSVTSPPTTKPDAPATAPAALQAATARARARPLPASDVNSVSAEGTAPAAPAPWMQPAAVRDTIEVAVDASRAPTPNTPRLMTIVRRCPKRSPNRAPNIGSPPKNIS